MFSQQTTSAVSLNPNKSKARGLIRVPLGKICRMETSNQDYDGLYIDDFLSCNIIIVHNKKRISMINADSSIDLAVIESEKKWVGEGVNIKVFFRENGIVLYKQIFGIMPKIKPISESTKAISAKFVDGVCVVEALADKPEKTIRHPQENRLETVHNINVSFFHLLHPAYLFNKKTKNQWKEQISKVVFDAEFWVMPNTEACDLHAMVFEKIAEFKGKSSEQIQGAIYRKMSGAIQEKMNKMPEKERINTQERMTRISLSVAESVWCYYKEYRLHDDAVDSKTINEAYGNISRKREEIKSKCQKIYDAESYDDIVTNFGIIKPFIKKFFCKEEGIVLALENRNISFIDFMEMRIKNSSLDLKQSLESFSSSIVPTAPCVVAATLKTVVSELPAKPAEVSLSVENAAEKTEHLGSKVLATTEDLENKKRVSQDREPPFLDKPATNAAPETTTVQAEKKAPILSDHNITQKPSTHKALEKQAHSNFPLIQARKTETHDNKQESEGGWLPAPTRRKPVLQAPKFRLNAEAPEFRPNAFLSGWEDTRSKGALKKVVPLAPQVAEDQNKPENQNKTVPPKDNHHFPVLCRTTPSSKPNMCKIPD